MAKSKSSARWLQEHRGDQYVRRSKEDGLRSRASYKIIELDDKDHLLGLGMTVVDLGAAPGGWSQVVSERVGDKGCVVACDILEMDSLPGVRFIQGDFTEENTYEKLLEAVNGKGVDLVISDMAPNMSGMKAIDIPRATYLVELALDMARSVLKKEGAFVAKAFQGEGFDGLIASCRESFSKVVCRKPGSSRARSRETYIVAKGFR